MSLFRQHWTPARAEQWTIHDLLACVLSTASYVLIGVGTAGTLLLRLWGFITLALGIVCIILLYFIIDPKLKAMSDAFARRQQEFLEHVDKTTRWEQ